MLHNILQTDSLYSLARHHGITKPCKTVYPLTDKLLTGRGLPSKSPAKGHWRHRSAKLPETSDTNVLGKGSVYTYYII